MRRAGRWAVRAVQHGAPDWLPVPAPQIFEQDLQKKGPEPVPLEFIPAQGLLGRRDDLCAQHFTLS